MKALLIVLGLPALVLIVIIAGSDQISVKMLEKAMTLTEPEKEEMFIKDIKFTHTLGRYERCMAIVNQYLETYDIYDEYDEGSQALKNIDYATYMRARTFDRLMKTREARKAYKDYMERFPEGEFVKKSQERLREITY